MFKLFNIKIHYIIITALSYNNTIKLTKCNFLINTENYYATE